MSRNLSSKAKNALMLSTLCTFAYLAVYIAGVVVGNTRLTFRKESTPS